MSLSRFAVRHCARMALLGATLAEDRVFQSEIDPLDRKVGENKAPMLIVNTDDHTMEGIGRTLTGGEEKVDLVIEATIAAKVIVAGADGDGDVVSVTVPGSDAGMDLTLDILEHQVARAIARADGVWGALLSRFILRFHSRRSRRGANSEGVRFAARQITLSCDLVADPVGGESLAAGEIWGDFVAALEADANTAPIGGLLRGVIGAGENPEWVRLAAMAGDTAATADAAAYWPSVTDEDGAAVVVDEIEIIDGDREE